MRYCPECATPLIEREASGRLRPACPACPFVHYADPKVAVAVVIERDGALLYGRRAPGASAAGQWSFPAGFVDRGERVEDAARRETREETGLTVHLDGLLGLYSSNGNPVILAVYVASIVGGILSPDDDLSELAFFPLDQLPEPAFPHDPRIVTDWLAWRDRAAR